MNYIKNLQDLKHQLQGWFSDSHNQLVHVEYVDRPQWDRLFVMLQGAKDYNVTITRVTIEVEWTMGTAIFIILNP